MQISWGIIFSDRKNIFKKHITYMPTVASRGNVLCKWLPVLAKPNFTIGHSDTSGSLVTPIIKYGSVIWSLCSMYDSQETLHLRFLKSNLVVKPQTVS